MKFTKMHGCGNDYIYVNGAEEKIPADKKLDIVRNLSDRHFGIGGDGVIFINPSDEADFEMEMYNADGSRAEMCGNGIRCVAKFVYDKGLTSSDEVSIVSAGKVKYLKLLTKENANHEVFLKRTNTEFVEVINRGEVNMRVWERGTGETLACGTGACATAVACMLAGVTDEKVIVHLLGGDLEIEWDRAEDRVYMTGPATTVFEGEVKGL